MQILRWSEKEGKLTESALVHPKPLPASPCTLLIYGKQCEPLPPRPAPARLACLLEQVSNLWSGRECSATGVSSMAVKHFLGYVSSVNPCQMLVFILTVLHSNSHFMCHLISSSSSSTYATDPKGEVNISCHLQPSLHVLGKTKGKQRWILT